MCASGQRPGPTTPPSERRSQTKDRHVGEPRRGRRQRGDDEGRQRAAAGQAVNRADKPAAAAPASTCRCGCAPACRDGRDARAVMMDVRRPRRSLARRQINRAQPSPTSMRATQSSKASDARAGISARRITSTVPTATSVSVCPSPQQTPRTPPCSCCVRP